MGSDGIRTMGSRGPRVLVCDDSALMRKVVSDLLIEGGCEVVGFSRDGADLVEAVRRLRPQVVTLDVEMPRMNGLQALKRLMAEAPTPVVMLSSLTGQGARETVEALASGAADAMQKPSTRLDPPAWNAAREQLLAKVRGAASARVDRLVTPPKPPARTPITFGGRAAAGDTLVVIATSTGGPRALAEVVPRLPSPLGAGVLIVQHMPVGFTASLAERLDNASALTVREARANDRIEPGTALLAPGGSHLEVSGMGATRLSSAPAIGGLRPRADITLETAARVYGRRVLCVVLTGMGHDGLEGAKAVVREGGRVLAEDESTCVVWGMPRAVTEAGLTEAVFPLDAIPMAIAEAVASTRRASGSIR